MCTPNVEFDPTVWLADRVPDYFRLPDNEKKAITDFCLLWGLFEARSLEENGCVRQIEVFVRSIEPALEENGRFLDDHLIYFQDRYVEPGGGFTGRFKHLNFRDNDNRPHVEAVLHGRKTDKAAILIALLSIVYRFRNNLFHGQKWRYELGGQFGNFSTANKLLMRVMELDARAQEP